MKFFVNFLSAFRIAAAFAIIPTLMFGLYWTTFILYVLAALSDWFDGFLARKYNVCSKLGGVMDHIGLREFLGTQKIEMPVQKGRFSMAKIKTTLQMITIAAFLLLFAIGAMLTPEMDSRTIMWLINILPHIGIWGTWLSLLASVWSATQYTITFSQKIKQIKK